MESRHTFALLFLLVLPLAAATAQEVDDYRILNITQTTSSPTQLAIDRGRLIWRDTDPNSGKYFLKYSSGADVMVLDSNLHAVSAAISGDHVVWTTHLENVKAFDIRSWTTVPIGVSYNPDFRQPVCASGDFAAYATRKPGTGTNILLHCFSSGVDTSLSAGVWNTAPSVHHGQVAWVASDAEFELASSSIVFFDGQRTRTISGTTGLQPRAPIMRDAQVVWVESGPPSWRVRLFTEDSVITLLEQGVGSDVCTGYDASNGIGVAALRDTITSRGRIEIFSAETGTRQTIPDSNGVWSVHIDNGLIVWQSGSGPRKRLRTHAYPGGLFEEIGLAENPVVDDGRIAWTLGDAVSLYVPVTYTRMTSDGVNGWEQTKFKTIDSSAIVWGNAAGNTTSYRLFYDNAGTTTQLTDSLLPRDLLMLNDGYLVWRSNFDSLHYYDGVHAPVKFLDTIQAENLYVAGGSIGFFGPRTTNGESIKRGWLYRIASGSLIQLTSGDAESGNVLCYGATACWRDLNTERMMFHDGATTATISDSSVTEHYSYRNGVIVWSERRNGIQQIMMYDIAAAAKTQVTNSSASMLYPITDGSHIVWYENAEYPFPAVNPVMWYYDVATSESRRVARTSYNQLMWNWMTDGTIAWTQDKNVLVCDGRVVTQLTSDDFYENAPVYLDRGLYVWRRAGDIFRGKLRAHAAFDAANIAGDVPLTVAFTNRSWEGCRSYLWKFGDGTSSTAIDPVHTYVAPGSFTVTLTVTGPTGTASEKKVQLVRALSSTAIAADDLQHPERTELLPNYPNPFNPTTEISYQIADAAIVTLKIYDVLGREVATLVNEAQSPGTHRAPWDGSQHASGIYYYTMKANAFLATRAMILMK